MFKSFFFLLLSAPLIAFEASPSSLIHPLGSLTFFITECASEEESDFQISSEELENLWQKSFAAVDPFSVEKEKLDQTYTLFCLAKKEVKEKEDKKVKKIFKKVGKSLLSLLDLAVKKEFPPENLEEDYLFLRSQTDLAFENNSAIPKVIKNKIRPYLIPLQHPLKNALDTIFYASRATLNPKSAFEAGFSVIATGPRSHVVVAKHSLLPDHLVKFHYDSDPFLKRNRPTWEWLMKRCEGAKKIQRIIEKYRVQHFVCAKKYLYVFPKHPFPAKSSEFIRHLACALVSDMHLEPKAINLNAWKNKITKQHLNELYIIISRGKGSSYRPDNINYNREKKFAFIDTEYPEQSPDYKSIRRYLNEDMQNYWDYLVKNGGKD